MSRNQSATLTWENRAKRKHLQTDTVCGAAQPVCSERSPVSNRQPWPHSSHVPMSQQAVFVPTSSYAGRDAASARRRPDPKRHAARRVELAQTVWRGPNSIAIRSGYLATSADITFPFPLRRKSSHGNIHRHGARKACGARSWRTQRTHQLRINSRRRLLPTMLPRTAA